MSQFKAPDPSSSLRVRIEPGAVVGDRVLFAEESQAETVVRSGARIGAGAVIGGGVEIGRGALVRPGSVVLSSVPANAVVAGNPAEVVGYVDAEPVLGPVSVTPPSAVPLDVGGAVLHRMQRVRDWRGDLTVGEVGRDLPFEPKRWFMVFGVPDTQLRGAHAHQICHQFLICVRGSCRTLLDDGARRREVTLESPDLGVYMPPMIWGTQYRYSADAVLLVFASHGYDQTDYLRSYDDFLAAVRERTA
jgi:hypothetical protein